MPAIRTFRWFCGAVSLPRQKRRTEEPLPAGHAFWTHPRITVTPHTSARTLRDESIAQIARKMVALEHGETVAGIVNPARGY